MNKKFLSVVLVFNLMLFFVGCDYVDKKYVRFGLAIGTDIAVTIFTNKPHWTVSADLDEVFALVDEYEGKLSCHIEQSMVSRLNQSKVLDVTDDFVYDVIKTACDIAALTGGAFEPTLGNVLQLWDFTGKPTVPDKDKLTESLETVGYRQLQFDGQTRTIRLETGSLDLGGIAKGAIVDCIAKYLLGKGYVNFLINGGGDIYVHGKHSGRRPWRIAVINPFDADSFVDTFPLTDTAIVTSGDYQRFFYKDGVKYHHILDAKDGYPVDNGIHGVTVLAKNAALADSLATAIFVMGADKAASFVEEYNSKNTDKIKAVVICGDKEHLIDTRLGF